MPVSPTLLVRHVSLVVLALSLAPLGCTADGDEGEDELGEAESSSGDSETGTGGETDTGDTGDTTDEGPSREELLAELEQLGPYEVGFEELELSYMPPGATEERVLSVLVWYPAAPGSLAPLVTYAVAGIVQLPSDTALDAPPVSDQGPFPLAVYSHGSGGEGLLAYPYAERFASHGWIVAAPSHAGNTASDEFGGGTDPFVIVAVNRPFDIQAVLDELDGGFAGHGVGQASDMDHVFMFGHSFGGYTSLAVGGAKLDIAAAQSLCTGAECDFLADPDVVDAFEQGFGDARVDAIAPQAPALIGYFEDGELEGLALPTLLQSGKLDITTPDATEAEPLWDMLDGTSDRWVSLQKGGHYSFITVCHDLDAGLLELFVPDNVNDGCGPDFTPTTELVPMLGTYLMAFARQHVLGEPQWSVLLEGESLHPEVELVLP